jgi:hypothetical protein
VRRVTHSRHLLQRAHLSGIKLAIILNPLADWADNKKTDLDQLVSDRKWATDPTKFVTDHKPKLLSTRRATLTKLRAKIRSVALGLLAPCISGHDLSKKAELASVLKSALGGDLRVLETICVEAMKEIAGHTKATEDDISKELLCFVLQEVPFAVICASLH